jgi:hypothetical protein
MEATHYKRQFLDFLKTVFPDGLPAEFNAITISVGDKKFSFQIDLDDYNRYKKRDTIKIKSKTIPVKLEDNLSSTDLAWLKEVRISIENIHEPENNL